MAGRPERAANLRHALRLLLRLAIDEEPGKTSRPRLQQLIGAGIRALQAGDRPRAITLCREVLAEGPSLARAHYLAGLIANDANDRAAALKAFEKTVTLNDQYAPAWAQLARIYLTTGEFVKAEGSLENAVACQQGNAGTLDLIGLVFRLAGNLEASLAWHAKAVTAAPEYVPGLINLANAHLYAGDRNAALACLQRALRKEPENPLLAWLICRARTATAPDHIEAMRKQLAGTSHPRAEAYLQYAIGKDCEDLEDWPAAFDAFAAGAQARRKTVAYDAAAEIAVYESAERLFTTGWLGRQSSDCYDNGPLFVVGLPRTGSTLLDRMLNAHPAVRSAGELRHFGFALRRATGVDEPRQFSAELLQAAAGCDVGELGHAYVRSTAGLRGDAAHVLDKLPSNFLYLPLMLASLPNARVLHVQRGAMDTCFAIYKTLFADAYLYSYDQAELAHHFVRYYRLMEAWRERFGERFLDVRYEELVKNPEASLREILEFTGLSWSADCLAYFENSDPVATQSAAQVREAPHSRSVGRWRRYEAALQPVADILNVAGIPLD